MAVDDLDGEIWRPLIPCKGFDWGELYHVSNKRRVKTLGRRTSRCWISEHLLDGRIRRGYRQMDLTCGSKRRTVWVAVLVAEAFICEGPISPDMEVHHGRGGSLDDSPENLSVVTHEEHRRLDTELQRELRQEKKEEEKDKKREQEREWLESHSSRLESYQVSEIKFPKDSRDQYHFLPLVEE